MASKSKELKWVDAAVKVSSKKKFADLNKNTRCFDEEGSVVSLV